MEFITGDVNKELLNLIESGKRVDSVIFDPPRKGIEGDALVKLAGHKICLLYTSDAADDIALV